MLRPVSFFFLTAVFFGACRKTDTFPVEPQIEFKDLVKYTGSGGQDTAAVLTLTFTDGDGDLGLQDSDTLPPYNPGSEYYYNFFLKWFRKENGVFVELPLTVPQNQRIPYIVNHSNNKAISGELLLDVEIAGLVANQDTFRYETYIIDRALHKSNVVTTGEIVLNTQ
jgi:hypothetical protein